MKISYVIRFIYMRILCVCVRVLSLLEIGCGAQT